MVTQLACNGFVCVWHLQDIYNCLPVNLNKANLRDLRAATGLVILLKLNSNCRFFSLCDLEIWWMTSKNNSAPLLYYIKLCASFQIHQWIQTGVTVRKPWIRINLGNFLSRVTLKFDGWPCKTIGHLFYATLSFVHLSKPPVNSNGRYGPERLYWVLPLWPWPLISDLELLCGHHFCHW